MTSDPLPDDRVRQLAAFAPRLRDPQAVFGKWRGGDPIEGADNCIAAPWFAQSELTDQLMNMLYRSGWVLEDFDWSRWGRNQRGQDFAVGCNRNRSCR